MISKTKVRERHTHVDYRCRRKQGRRCLGIFFQACKDLWPTSPVLIKLSLLTEYLSLSINVFSTRKSYSLLLFQFGPFFILCSVVRLKLSHSFFRRLIICSSTLFL
ncbi:hypothetical protein Scep_003602 [Stephania cephalantha]|uniref:Uncharacterized protein n=1 Tax=Stephania cephalantha TaxID=152367 RepID=A0AAP0PUL6_9MAGN